MLSTGPGIGWLGRVHVGWVYSVRERWLKDVEVDQGVIFRRGWLTACKLVGPLEAGVCQLGRARAGDVVCLGMVTQTCKWDSWLAADETSAAMAVFFVLSAEQTAMHARSR